MACRIIQSSEFHARHLKNWIIVYVYLVLFRYTVICSGYKIPGYFSELSSGKYTAQFKRFYDSSYALTHVWVSMAFRSHFSISGHHMKHYLVHNVLLNCNKYLFIPTLYGNLKFHNLIIISSIPYRTRQARSLSRRATQFWEKTNSKQTLTFFRAQSFILSSCLVWLWFVVI